MLLLGIELGVAAPALSCGADPVAELVSHWGPGVKNVHPFWSHWGPGVKYAHPH